VRQPSTGKHAWFEALEARHLDADDIDLLLAATRTGDPGKTWDPNGDQFVDARDAHFGMRQLAAPRAGDTDLNNAVDIHDFCARARNFGREDAHWQLGDFDDGAVRLADFVRLVANAGFSRPVAG
jgi:hypothetical protein